MNFITGGTGLLGSHLLYDLLNKGEKVRALKRSSSDISQVKKIFSYYSNESTDLFNRIEWVDGDMLDYNSIKDALAGIDHVYHCAAIVSFDPQKRNQIIHDNVDGTAHIVNACIEQQIKKYCQVSSVAAIGRTGLSGSVTEEGKWLDSKNKSAYAISKHLSEMEVWRGIAEGLDAVIVNPSIILGPGKWEEGSSKIFSGIYNGLRFYTKGIMGYVDVRDVSNVMISLMESQVSGNRYIINSENLSYEQVFKMVASDLGVRIPDIYARKWMSELGWRLDRVKEIITGKPALLTKETARASHKKSEFSNQKIIKELDFKFIQPKQSIKDISKIFLAELKLNNEI